MTLRLPSLTDTFKVVLRSPIDSAVTCDDADYSQYLDTLDESLLKLSGEPTRLVMRKVLPALLQAKVQNAQFAIEDGQMAFKFGSFAEDVRCSIVGIENPAEVPASEQFVFKKAPDGGAHEEIITLLGAAGVVMDLYRAKQTAIGSRAGEESLKKK